MTKQTDTIALAGRILIGVLFLMAGLSKLGAPAATQAYIGAVGLPAPIAAYGVALVVELVGSVLLIVGFQVRIVAAVLAVFTLVTALFFHNNFADQNQMIHFLKNVAIWVDSFRSWPSVPANSRSIIASAGWVYCQTPR